MSADHPLTPHLAALLHPFRAAARELGAASGKLQAELAGGTKSELHTREPIAAESSPTYGHGAQRRLFPGQQTLFGREVEDPPRRGRRK